MEFLSIPFVVCLMITFVLYYAHNNRRWQHIILLVASVVFIGYYHISYLLVAAGITWATYLAGQKINATLGTSICNYWLTISIIGLVGFWLLARYWFAVFPLGISFYTFQALSYLIEIYWEEEPEDDFLDFMLYMMFFAKFLSGPIERGGDFLPQLKKARAFDYTLVVRGLKMVAWGAFLRLIVADRIAPSLDIVFNDVQSASGIQILVATALYPIQLYADFAGYTCMALGVARIMGFTLQPNFNRPFISKSTGELWRRWHMSLSLWVRDYVFTPLNASHRTWGKWGVCFSLLLTFVSIGVWHGAGWAFAIYGLFQGIVIIIEMLLGEKRNKCYNILGNKIGGILMMIRTYVLFALSLLFFRMQHLQDVFYAYAHMFDGLMSSVKELRLGMSDFDWIVFSVAVLIIMVVEYLNGKYNLIKYSEQLCTPFRWLLYFILVFVIIFYGSFGVENFIYIQF